ncbi:ribosome recycling factor [Catalinimonas alkaloidigena]|uniref:ribosome recycling factor n=1 Tax=Catalinimonas alkaloidigena TaxID=1075417 RepID=UPI0024049679|nr:ribosome recycling factor [Catalinimonas alkaloidigena]MDF9795528.1 ribosome recycling factor [Catalinimonas alkaloidigena]
MTEEIQMYLDEAEENMKKAVEHVIGEFKKIRAGKAQPNMLDGLMVEYYGNNTPINQVASITTPDARTVMIKPWEKKMVNEIERAIINSDLGLNPQNDGEVVRLNIPPLTEERRKNLVKQAKNEAENGKVSVRNIRKDANDSIKKLLKDGTSEDDVKEGEDNVQELTDKYSNKIDSLFEEKDKEIMTV